MPQSSASIVAQTRPGFAGEAATPIRPLSPSGSPGLDVMSVQVSPPSIERHIPLSGPPLVMLQKFRRACQIAA